jgi:glycosyltransferase involved in cell wall biosynthesis
VAQYRTLEALQGACEFTLLFPAYSAEHETDVCELKRRLSKVSFVPVRCYETPMPPPPPPRMTFRRVLVNILRKIFPAPKVHFEKTAELDLNTIKGEPEPLPYYPFHNLHPDFVKAVDRELDKGYDIFQAEFCDMLSLGPIVGDRAKKLFIHHQLHFIYAERLLKSLHKPSAQARYLADRMRLEEKVFLDCFDTAVVFSDTDADLLRGFSPHLQVEVSPFPSPYSSYPPSETAPDCEAFILLSSDYHPNIDGFIWFMEKVWPLIKAQRPGSSIEVVGKWSEETQKKIPNFTEVGFLGYVEEISTALKNKVMVVPLKVGSGIRTKILAAWSVGCPVVSTRVGAEGLCGKNGEDYILADDAESFAEACLSLAADPHKRRAITSAAAKTVYGNYSLKAVGQKRLRIYHDLIGGVPPN